MTDTDYKRGYRDAQLEHKKQMDVVRQACRDRAFEDAARIADAAVRVRVARMGDPLKPDVDSVHNGNAARVAVAIRAMKGTK